MFFLPDRRENENCGTLTPIRSEWRKRTSSIGSGSIPTKICVATAIKSWSNVLETNGNERDTRTLHSITFNSLS